MLHLQENAAAFHIQLSGEEKAFLEDIFHHGKVTFDTVAVSPVSPWTCAGVLVCLMAVWSCGTLPGPIELTRRRYSHCVCRSLGADIMETLPNSPTML